MSRPATSNEILSLLRAAELKAQSLNQRWLIHSLWAGSAVGIIGGAPKCCKSWLGLEMAVSVASGTPCLGKFPIEQPGPTLIYMAEDSLPTVRSRIEALCHHRHLDIQHLELYAIAHDYLRLDTAEHRQALWRTAEHLRPRLLLLDPLVRLHRLDENSACEMSTLLTYLRQMQRAFDLAIALVHHTCKKHRSHPGQALRGSGDLHAFGDSNAYLTRKDDHLLLTIEHRSAPAPKPLPLRLASRPDGEATHLELLSPGSLPHPSSAPLASRVLQLLRQSQVPLSRGAIRAAVRANKQRLGQTLLALEKQGQIYNTPQGCLIADSKDPPPLHHDGAQPHQCLPVPARSPAGGPPAQTGHLFSVETHED